MPEPYVVNVSSVQDFMQCRFRWWAKWIMNRVPLNEMPALGAGKLLHTIFEDAFLGINIELAARARCAAYRVEVMKLPERFQASHLQGLQSIEDLIEALPLWKDHFRVDKVLEVEEPFTYEVDGIIWRGRPDRVVLSGGRIWHVQNRGLAAGMNFGTYMRLALRHYHEHLYGEYLEDKYGGYKHGGTVFNLVRKLKYRTNVGKKNEQIKTAEEMFYQQAVSYNMRSGLHKAVMMSLNQHVAEMRRVTRHWIEDQEIPAPNEKMNGGFGGNSEDPFFKVLIGEISLDDDELFKDREDTYAQAA